jgi:uncharacterized iron-regulated protein
MKKITNAIVLTLLAFISNIVSSCNKDENNENIDVAVLKTEILEDIANKVCLASYQDMNAKADELLTAVNTLSATTNDVHLNTCRSLWKDIRETWERSEAWLFGPVQVDNIDPKIDTWPVDFNDLNTVLAGSDVLDETYIDALDEKHDALKGFHPIEYLLWGKDGNKTASAFTNREKEYLTALAQHLKKLANQLQDSWQSGYADALATAGHTDNSNYPTMRIAFETIVDAMESICDEVANGKIKDPFEAQNPELEESPFAQNSIIDFINNIKGVMDIYQGKFNDNGKGLEDLVRTYHLSLDNDIKAKHAAAIAALQAITVSFGQAIITQQTQVQTAMAKINELTGVLANNLKPFVQQYGQ